MRLTTVLFIASLMQVSAATFGQKITLNRQNESLATLFREIRKQSGFNFYYDGRLVTPLVRGSIKVSDVSVDEALKNLLAGLPLAYEIKDKLIIITKKAPPSFLERLADSWMAIEVRGRVLDEHGAPLAGATVLVKGKSTTYHTNARGEFYIGNVAEDAVLVISYVGYKPLEVNLKQSKMPLELKLNLATGELEDVEIMVNTGYQTLPKERATGSFTQINNELFNRSTSGNVLERLEGITNGMLFTRKDLQKENLSGQAEIRVRGVNTILGNKSPLIVVDNFPYSGDINQLNPNDVESVTVLKDAAAASIWGALAGNGVIVINTKSGRYNQATEVSFNSNVIIGDKPDLFYSQRYLPASTVMDIQKENYDKGAYFRLDAQRLPLYVELLYKLKDNLITQQEFDATEAWYRSNDLRQDWTDYLYQKSLRQQNSLSVRGGGDRYRYAFSANYDTNRESYVGNDGSRVNLSLQNTFKVTPNLELTGTVWYSKSPKTSNAVLASITNSFNSVGPDSYESLVDQNGNPNPINLTSNRYFYQEQIQKKYPTAGMADWLMRPLDEIKYNDNKSSSVDLRLNGGLKYKFLKYFNADFNFQYISSRVEQENYYAPESYYVRDLYNKYTQIPGVNSTTYTAITHIIPLGGILQRPGVQTVSSQSGRGVLSYTQNFTEKHSISAIAGGEIRQSIDDVGPGVTLYNYDKDLLTASALYDYAFTYRNLPSVTGRIPTLANNVLSNKTTRDLSYFGNASYTYNKKYIVSGSMRWDGSNLLGVKANQRGTILWSAGLAWDISKEAFFPQGQTVSYFKLRSTFGSAGNIDRSQTHYPTIRDAMDGNTLAPIANLVSAGNPSLKWEQVNTLNFGADFQLFKGRITGSAEYYRKYASDLLGNNFVDPTTGVPTTFKRNYGAMQTWGWDIQLASRNVEIGKFAWTSNLIFNTSANKITRLAEYVPVVDNQYFLGGTLYSEKGKSVDKIYALPWYGLNPADGSVLLYDANGQITKTYTAYYAAVKKSTFIDAGVTVPKISSSLMNTFQWDGFSISALIVGRFDYVFRRSSISPGAEFQNLLTPTYHMDYFKRWKNPGDELITNVPAGVAAKNVTTDLITSGTYYQNSEALITKGDVIRLQDITFGYRIPKRLITTWPLKSLRVYANARNLGIIWRANKQGLDPDYPNTLYPQPKSYSFGIQADF